MTTLVDAELSAALTALARGDFEQAHALYQSILREAPHCVEAILGEGVARRARGSSESEGVVELIELLIESSDDSNAERICRRAMAIPDLQPELQHDLAITLGDLGHPDEAREVLAQLAERYPEDSGLLFNLGYAHELVGDAESAINSYRSALELDPLCLDAAHNLATCLSEAERWAEAIPLFETVTRNESEYLVESWNDLGICYSRVGRRADAIDAYRAAVAIDAAYGDAWYNLGLTLEREGRFPEALESYEAARGLDPGCRDTKTAIRRVRLRVRKNET